jgi:WD40 repeat protein/tetratricopeptide (TPR) repeat protein
MGIVYEAWQTQLKRPAAIKMLLEGDAAAHALERFRVEAEAIARLRHPHIIQIYEIGESDGRPFFSLEYADGGSLADFLNGTPLPASEAARLAEILARAMHAAHEHGIVHRDLKPANVLLASAGRTPPHAPGAGLPTLPSEGSRLPLAEYLLKITDFGLAKRLEETSGRTATGAILGTPSYMAPEQAGAKKDVGPAADTYALGAILYELLTGRPPFRAATDLDTVLQVISEEPVPPSRLQPTVPRDVETICLRCLQKTPARRYPSAEALADDLRRFRNGEPIAARPVGWPERSWRWCCRNPVPAILLAIVVLSLLGGSGVSAFFAIQASRRADDADRASADATWAAGEADRSAGDAKRETVRSRQQEALARRRLYAARMNLAQQAWKNGQTARVLELLESVRPKSADEEDLRGFEWYYLQRLCQQDWRTLIEHEGMITGLAFSPEGRYLASAGQSGQGVKLWSVAAGTIERVLPAVKGAHYVVFSPDGKYVATTDGTTLGVWEVATGRLQFARPYPAEEGPTYTQAVAYTPDGKLLVTRGPAGATLIDAKVGREIRQLTAPGFKPFGHSTTYAVAPDGRSLAAAGFLPSLSHGAVQVWALPTGQPRFQLPHNDYAEAVVFTPDSSRILSGDRDSHVSVWDARSGKKIHELRGHVGNQWGLAVGPDGALATGDFPFPDLDSERHSVQLWNPRDGGLLSTMHGHTSGIMALALHPQGGLIASAATGEIKLWDRSAGHDAVTLSQSESTIASVAVSPDGRRLAWNSQQQVVVCDSETGRTVRVLPLTSLVGSGPVEICAWADADTLALRYYSSDNSAWAEFRDVGTGRMTARFVGARSVAFSPDRRCFALALEGAVEVRETASGQVVGGFPTESEVFGRMAFFPDNRRLVVTQQSCLAVWNFLTGREERRFTYAGQLQCLFALSRDCRRLALGDNRYDERVSGRQFCTIRIWDTDSGVEQLRFAAHPSIISGLVFTSDGSRLITSGADQTIRLWDAVTGQELASFGEGSQVMRRLALSPDGQRLFTADAVRPNTLNSVSMHRPRSYGVKVWDARPLTPELRDKRAALALVRYLLDGGTPAERLVTKIRYHTGFSPAVKDLAVALVPGMVREIDLRRAADLVARLGADLLLREAVLERVQGDASLTSGVRGCALDIAANLPESAQALNDAAWKAVVQPGAGGEGIQLALRQAEQACRLAPENGEYLNTLGAARYRLGQFGPALETLVRSDRINSSHEGISLPSDLAFLTMAYHRLGQNLSAVTSLGRLRESMLDSRWGNDAESQSLLREAQTTVEGHSSAAPGTDEELIRAIEQATDPSRLHQLALECENRGQWDRAGGAFAKAAALRPQDPSLWHQTARAFAAVGRWKEAVACLERVFALTGPAPHVLFDLAHCRFATGDAAGYRRACALLVEHFPPSKNNWHAAYVLWACVLAPESVSDLAPLLALADQLPTAQQIDLNEAYWYTGARGATLLRAGRYKEAVERLEQTIEERPHDIDLSHEELLLVQAYARLGRREDALRLFHAVEGRLARPALSAAAVTGLTASGPLASPACLALPAVSPGDWWRQWLWTRQFHREARALLGLTPAR